MSLERWIDHCPSCDFALPSETKTAVEIICPNCGAELFRLDAGKKRPWIPRRLGEFRVRGFLAEGGMSLVLKGIGPSPKNEHVALKIPYREFVRNNLSELEVLKNITEKQLPYIAPLLGCSSENDKFIWTAVKWIDGRSILAYRNDITLAQKDRIAILAKIAEGVSALHENGIIHGDISPGNALLTKDLDVRLIDFGISRTLEHTDRTIANPFSTPAYTAPEIFQEGVRPSVKTDIYSFGKLALEFLPENSRGFFLKRLLKKCTEMQPEKRPNSMKTIERSLKSKFGFIPELLFYPVIVVMIFSLLSLASLIFTRNGDSVNSSEGNKPDETIIENAESVEPEILESEPVHPPPPRDPDWLKFVQLREYGSNTWRAFEKGERFDTFTQWKIDGKTAREQFVDRDFREFMEDVSGNLRILEIHNCNYLSSEAYSNIRTAVELRKLNIVQCKEFDDRAIAELFPNPLKTAEDSDSSGLLGDFLGGSGITVSGNRNLIWFSIYTCPGITDEAMDHLPGMLETLLLNRCENITDSGLAKIPNYCPKLKHLSLKQTGITYKGVSELFGIEWRRTNWVYIGNFFHKKAVSIGEPKFPELEKLELDGCSMDGYGKKLSDFLEENHTCKVTGIEM